MTHDELQEQIVDLAHLFGWRHLHVRRTIGRGKKWTTATNVKGWPDLFFWHPTRGGSFAAELKTDNAPVVRPEQSDVLAELAAAGIPAYVWFPADLDVARHAFDQQRGTVNMRADVAGLLLRMHRALLEEGLKPDRPQDGDDLILRLSIRVGAEAAGYTEHDLWEADLVSDAEHAWCEQCATRRERP